MGLNMYLTRKVYLGLNFEHNRQKETQNEIVLNGKTFSTENLKSLEYSAVYWRKSNAIHKFFVDEVQEGIDDCRTSYVSEEVLKKLVEYCKKDLEYLQNTKEIDEEELNLKTQKGFFFGSTEYDEYYIEDLENTIKEIEPLLEFNSDSDFYYHSSW